MMLQADNYIQPLARSSKQLLMRKIKHAGQIDREIRKNWKNFFKFMNQERVQLSPNPERSSPLHKRIMTECSEGQGPRGQMQRQNSNPKHLLAMHSELKRKKVHERQRKNEEIFFKKRTCEVQSLHKERRKQEKGAVMGLEKRHSMQLQKKCSAGQTLPFMLRRRREKVQKEMSIIRHDYKNSLQKIENKDHMKCSLNLQDRQELINRMKGSKIYYQFTKAWRSDQQDTI